MKNDWDVDFRNEKDVIFRKTPENYLLFLNSAVCFVLRFQESTTFTLTGQFCTMLLKWSSCAGVFFFVCVCLSIFNWI